MLTKQREQPQTALEIVAKSRQPGLQGFFYRHRHAKKLADAAAEIAEANKITQQITRAFDKAPIGVQVADAKSMIIAVNNYQLEQFAKNGESANGNGAESTKAAAERYLNKVILDTIHPDSKTAGPLVRLFKNGEPFATEEPYAGTSVSGKRLAVITIGIPVLKDDGTVRFGVILNLKVAELTKEQLEEFLKTDYLRKMPKEVFRALARMLERRDPYTEGHGGRVDDYAAMIAEALDLHDDDKNALFYAACLHDIEKSSIPDSILFKDGKLTNEEFDRMKEHPDEGAKIVDALKMPSVATAIRHHHEYYDGTGYPSGLSGKDIPLLSRILAVADAYDAMTSDRPYRKALPNKEAIRRIQEASGTQFDPKIVQVFVDCLKRNEKENGNNNSDQQVLDLASNFRQAVKE